MVLLNSQSKKTNFVWSEQSSAKLANIANFLVGPPVDARLSRGWGSLFLSFSKRVKIRPFDPNVITEMIFYGFSHAHAHALTHTPQNLRRPWLEKIDSQSSGCKMCSNVAKLCGLCVPFLVCGVVCERGVRVWCKVIACCIGLMFC